MIIRRSKIAHAMEKRGQEVQERADREWQKKLDIELENQQRKHDIAMADKLAEISRLNSKIARQENICAEAEKKRLQANELIVAAKSIVNEIGEEVADGFDTFRRLHGLFDRAKNNVARLEDKK